MNLYCYSQGQGKKITLLHGWGLSGNVWEGVAAQLSKSFFTTWLDLPGYGRSSIPANFEYSLLSLAEIVAKQLEDNSTVLGWSLGGMVAMQLAISHPRKIGKLILVASSPQFFVSPDWPHAVDSSVLENFAAGLSTSYRSTVLQFLAIQALGSEHAREEIRVLRNKVFRDGDPDTMALTSGLNILLTDNLRNSVERINCPTLVIAGEKDRLMPPDAAAYLANKISNSQLQVINGASHAPFISHPTTFTNLLTSFIND